MDRVKITTIVAPILVSLICIVLAVNVGITNSKLNFEKAENARANERIIRLAAQLSNVKTGSNAQAKLVSDLQFSLDVARKETETAKQEVESLKQAKISLESRLNAASQALTVSAASAELTETAAQ